MSPRADEFHALVSRTSIVQESFCRGLDFRVTRLDSLLELMLADGDQSGAPRDQIGEPQGS